MSYCLLLKGADGRVQLLSETPFVTRKEALDALALRAASDLVNGAKDQVWLVDLNALAPVVLFARTTTLEAEPEPEPEREPEPVVTDDFVVTTIQPGQVFEPEAEPIAEQQPEAAGAAESIDESEREPEEGPELEPQPQVEPGAPVVTELAPAMTPEVVGVDSEDVPPTLELVPEAEPQVEIQAEAEPSILDDLLIPEIVDDSAASVESDDSFSDLREALAHSVAQMEDEGGVPTADDAREPAFEVPEPMPAVDAVFETPLSSAAQAAGPGLPEPEAAEGDSGWPWAAVADVPESSIGAEAPVSGSEQGIDEGHPSPAPEIHVPEVIADTLVPVASAFGVEIDEVVAPTTVDTPGYTPGAADVGSMSCDDCVWVETCPNKGEREPSSCGSFQWK